MRAKALVITQPLLATRLRATYPHVCTYCGLQLSQLLSLAFPAYPHGTVVVLATKATLSLQMPQP